MLSDDSSTTGVDSNADIHLALQVVLQDQGCTVGNFALSKASLLRYLNMPRDDDCGSFDELKASAINIMTMGILAQAEPSAPMVPLRRALNRDGSFTLTGDVSRFGPTPRSRSHRRSVSKPPTQTQPKPFQELPPSVPAPQRLLTFSPPICEPGCVGRLGLCHCGIIHWSKNEPALDELINHE